MPRTSLCSSVISSSRLSCQTCSTSVTATHRGVIRVLARSGIGVLCGESSVSRLSIISSLQNSRRTLGVGRSQPEHLHLDQLGHNLTYPVLHDGGECSKRRRPTDALRNLATFVTVNFDRHDEVWRGGGRWWEEWCKGRPLLSATVCYLSRTL